MEFEEFNRFARVYLVPGAVFQSVLIGGGYGTGRENVEFFTQHGSMGGLLAILIATLSIAVVFALTLSLAVRFNAFEYRKFFQTLLGRAWFSFELLAVVLFVLVLGVLGAAAGSITRAELGLPRGVGISVILLAVVILTFYGRSIITALLTYWSVLLYVVFAAYLISTLTVFSGEFRFDTGDASAGWWISGFQYSFYNVTAIPVVLYAARAIKTMHQAVLAGLIGACIGTLPAVMLHLSFLTYFPDILTVELPIYAMFDRLNVAWLKIAYLVILFGTFIETGAGIVQGLIERMDGYWTERHGHGLSRRAHASIGAATMLLAAAASSIGIVDLIANGYGTLAWGFLAVYVLPLLTVGVWKLRMGQN
jgi:uncharacterized membrane protein YkvI